MNLPVNTMEGLSSLRWDEMGDPSALPDWLKEPAGAGMVGVFLQGLVINPCGI
jgi:hypothetical protein